MKRIIPILLFISMFIYGYAGTVSEGFNRATIQSRIKEVEGQFIPPNGDFASFEKQVTGYSDLGIIAIPVTEKLVDTYLNTFSESDKDSVYELFNRVFYKAVNEFNTTLESKYSTFLAGNDIEPEIYDTINTEKLEFNKSLDICGLTLLNSEGSYYVDARYDYEYDLFHDRVSPALTEFLKIRKKELKEGFSEDAGMLISFNQLYDRVVIWEDFMTKYPDFFQIKDARFYYSTYLSTLLSGMDNSLPCDTETGILLPEVKKLYLKISLLNDSRKSTNVVKDYVDLLKTTDFKMPDSLDQFLQKYDLFSMKGVEPENR